MEDEKNKKNEDSNKKIKSNSLSKENEVKKAKEEMKNVPSTIWKYIVSVFSFKQDKDLNVLEVIESIKSDIEFKGANVWILICSIIIASIGLNTNSVAVIIGAMLISPLMGPIKGIGLAVGTNNFKLLIYSLMNFGVATVVSVLASFFYFKIMPFKDATPEILERTEPVIIAVFIAFFGGLAGIISSIKNSNSTVAPGVAIATALMPPLCVTGYGLAVGNTTYFLGAFYLFILNALFITLVTILVIRYLKFPLASYINKKKERNIKIYIGVFLALVLIPSGIKFTEVINKTYFNNTAQLFINEEIKSIEGVQVINHEIDFKTKKITVFLGINDYIPERMKSQLKKELTEGRFKLADAKLFIEQNEDKDNHFTIDDYKLLMNDWKDKIIEKNKKISILEKENESKNKFKYNLHSFKNKLEFESEFKDLNTFSVSNSHKLNLNGKIDTVLLIVTSWNDTLIRKNRTKRMNDWIRLNMETSNFELIERLNKK